MRKWFSIVRTLKGKSICIGHSRWMAKKLPNIPFDKWQCTAHAHAHIHTPIANSYHAFFNWDIGFILNDWNRWTSIQLETLSHIKSEIENDLKIKFSSWVLCTVHYRMFVHVCIFIVHACTVPNSLSHWWYSLNMRCHENQCKNYARHFLSSHWVWRECAVCRDTQKAQLTDRQRGYKCSH